MAFLEISFNAKRPLILGRGGFGTQLNDWLLDEGWGSADFLDDNAPDAVGGLRDYPDPAILHPGRPAFVALGDNKLRVELLQKLTAAGYATPVFISDAASVSPSAVLEPGCISCRAPMWGPASIWASAASSTPGPSLITMLRSAAVCMWHPAASSRRGPWLLSTPRSIPARSSAPRGRAVDGPPP